MLWFLGSLLLAALSVPLIAWGIVTAEQRAGFKDFAALPGLILLILALDGVLSPFVSHLASWAVIITALGLKIGVGLGVFTFLLRGDRAKRLVGMLSGITTNT